MDNCNCVEPLWAADDMQMKYQYFADFLIALAYFSIPCELVYFVKKSAVFPYRWVLVLFGAFIVLCGTTHFINLWTFGVHARTVAIVMTVAKLLTALVSCATALTLVHVIPDLLSVKTREHFLRNKADELDREMGIIRNQEETGRYVRMLTQEIRSTLDKNTILKTTLVELGKALALEECTVWMPAKNGMELTLEHSFRQTKMHRVKATVPIHHPSLQQVFSSNRARSIPSTSPVAMAMLRPSSGRISTGDVLGVRVPLLHLTDFEIGDWPEPAKKLYALMVLALPSDSARKWRKHEMELVENVSEQVAVALSHAAVLEQSTRDRNQLLEQNRALSLARHEAETAIHARNDFFAVMNHEMKTPMDAIISSSMLLQGSELSAEQRSMVETIVKNSKLLSTLIADVLDISRLEDGTFQLSNLPFNVPWMFQEVLKLVRPVALMKKLSLHMNLSSDIPEYAIGDQKRLMQTVLNIVGNAIKFTKEGNITVIVSIDKLDESSPALHLQHILGEQYMPLRVEVKDTGIGLSSQEIPKLFNKFVQANSASRKQYGGTGLSLAICKKFVTLMGGDIWIESEGPGKGTTVTFVVKLGCFNEMERQLIPSIQASGVQTDFTGLKVLLVDGHSVNRMVMKGLLMRLGCDVTDASTGRECLQLLFQIRLRFKVILIDVCLSDMDGFDVLVWIREKFVPHERPSIVAFLPNADPSVQKRCQELGVAVLGYKPLSLEKMQNLLTGIVQRGGLITQTR